MKKKKNGTKKKSGFLLKAILAVLAAVFVFSAYKLVSEIYQYKSAERKYSGLSSDYVLQNSSGSARYPGFVTDGDYVADGGQPSEPEISPISVDFAELTAKAPDTVAWLYSPDTAINYPVLQGPDNFYYLHKYIDGSYNSGGSLYIDCDCRSDFSSRNTIIYGHNMNDGSMLHSLTYYKDQSFYDEHPSMYLNTPAGNYRIDIFSAFVTDPEAHPYKIVFEDDIRFEEYLQQMISYSDFRSRVKPDCNSRIVTMSTCTYEYDDARYVVLGILIPIC